MKQIKVTDDIHTWLQREAYKQYRTLGGHIEYMLYHTSKTGPDKTPLAENTKRIIHNVSTTEAPMVASKSFARKVKQAEPGAAIPVKEGDLTPLNIPGVIRGATVPRQCPVCKKWSDCEHKK